MADDDLLSPWRAIPEAERRTIVAALQAIADREGEAVKWSGVDSLCRKPVADVFAARRGNDGLVVHFFYDFRIGRWAQSGSDWDEHHFHVGDAVCRDGGVVSHAIAKDMRSIIEYDCPSYDEAEAAQSRRAAAVTEFRKEWRSLPL